MFRRAIVDFHSLAGHKHNMLPIRHSSIRRLFTPALLFSTCLKVQTEHTPRGAVATATAVARNAAHVDNPAIQKHYIQFGARAHCRSGVLS